MFPPQFDAADYGVTSSLRLCRGRSMQISLFINNHSQHNLWQNTEKSFLHAFNISLIELHNSLTEWTIELCGVYCFCFLYMVRKSLTILFEMFIKWFLMNGNLVLFSYRSLESDQTGPVFIWGEETWRHSEDVMCNFWLQHDKLRCGLDTTETRESSGVDRVDEHWFKFC